MYQYLRILSVRSLKCQIIAQEFQASHLHDGKLEAKQNCKIGHVNLFSAELDKDEKF